MQQKKYQLAKETCEQVKVVPVVFIILFGMVMCLGLGTWTNLYMQALVRDPDNGEIKNMLEAVERQLNAVCYIYTLSVLLIHSD